MQKSKCFVACLGGAFRERVAPGTHTERGYYVEAGARVIHAAFMQARGFFSSSRITAGQNAPDRTNRQPMCLGASLDNEPRLQNLDTLHASDQRR